jgi:hypothetical protein
MAKEIRAMRVKSLRANKSLRDHRAIPASVSAATMPRPPARSPTPVNPQLLP